MVVQLLICLTSLSIIMASDRSPNVTSQGSTFISLSRTHTHTPTPSLSLSLFFPDLSVSSPPPRHSLTRPTTSVLVYLFCLWILFFSSIFFLLLMFLCSLWVETVSHLS